MMIGKDLNVSRVQVYDVHAFNKQLKSEAKMSQKSQCVSLFSCNIEVFLVLIYKTQISGSAWLLIAYEL